MPRTAPSVPRPTSPRWVFSRKTGTISLKHLLDGLFRGKQEQSHSKISSMGCFEENVVRPELRCLPRDGVPGTRSCVQSYAVRPTTIQISSGTDDSCVQGRSAQGLVTIPRQERISPLNAKQYSEEITIMYRPNAENVSGTNWERHSC